MDSCAGIVCDGLDSMAFFLVDQGCDLWLNNSRGNRHSKNHKNLDPSVHKQFWDFSFQEMGQYDQPALFNYILSQTKVDSITYIGHSQGTS